MNSNQIKLGAVLSYVQIAAGAIITLLYTPFIIRTLGQSEYGLYNTVSSVVSSLSILSLGFGSSYVRFYTRYKTQGKENEVAGLNGMFMTIFLVIGAIALVCGTFLSFNLHYVFADGLTEQELVIAKRLMMLLTLNLAISFPSSVFTSIITANEQFIFQKLLNLGKQVVSPLVCIPLLLMGFGSTGMVVSMVTIYLLVDLSNALFCVKKLRTRFSFGSFDWSVFKELAVYSVFIAINMIVDQINLSLDKILLGRYCGTSSVAVYSAGYTLYHYFQVFSTSISNVFTPRIHQIWNNSGKTTVQKDADLTKLFVQVGRIQFMILLLVCSGLVFFGRQFIRIWAGPTYGNAYWIVLLLSISSIVPLSQNVGIEIQRTKNKHQFRSLVYLGMALINLVLSVILCQKYGEIGSAVGTAISFIFANTIIMNIYYDKALHIDVFQYWKMLARTVAAEIPAYVFGFVLCSIMDTSKIIPMLMGIVLYSLVYAACMFLFGCGKEERNAVLQKVRRVVQK